jgi:preprotein translocase subunit SecG
MRAVEIGYRIAIGLGILVAVLFTALVVLTGKGDAMSGGGSIRTTYKGKASFDDQISKWTLILGALFMALMLIVDGLSRYVAKS